jgi:hypothetical protein
MRPKRIHPYARQPIHNIHKIHARSNIHIHTHIYTQHRYDICLTCKPHPGRWRLSRRSEDQYRYDELVLSGFNLSDRIYSPNNQNNIYNLYTYTFVHIYIYIYMMYMYVLCERCCIGFSLFFSLFRSNPSNHYVCKRVCNLGRVGRTHSLWIICRDL